MIFNFSTARTSVAPRTGLFGDRGLSAALDLLAAASFAGAALLSSLYCVLAYIPSTYFAFIHAPFLSWMPLFARTQPYLFTVTFCGTAASTYRTLSTPLEKRLAWEVSLFGAALCAYLLYSRPLQGIGNHSISFIWAVAFLFLIVCFGTLDYLRWLPVLHNHPTEQSGFAYPRIVFGATIVAISYHTAAYARYYLAGGRQLPRKSDLVLALWATAMLVLLFVVVFSVIIFAARVANAAANPQKLRFLLFTLLWFLGTMLLFYKVLLASIPFEGVAAATYASLLSLALVGFAGGRVLRKAAVTEQDGILQRNPRVASRKLEAALWLFLMAANLTIPALIGAMDWNAIFEKSWAITYWMLIAWVVVVKHRASKQQRISVPVVAAGLTFLLLRLGLGAETTWGHTRLEKDFDSTVAIERYSAMDASFAAANQLLTATASPRQCDAQCQFIREQTNIAPSALLQLRNLDLVQHLASVKGKKPNIFIIVVDSLRQDYLSAYNPEVSFTPAIGSFAKDSVIFRNAFTRYAGTTLAEPSIWSGTVLLHKHYPQPFHLVDGLEKLIETDGYSPFISIDTVLQVILQPPAGTVRLDADESKWTDQDFCSTSDEFISQIDRRRPDGPIFFYTQPQNVHVVTLGKTISLRPPRKNYSPFVSPYASELQRLDGCFGDFVQALKKRGIYDNSIVILTADHGEDLKKMGPQRHAFSLRPEVIKIPLIIHIPKNIEKHWFYDQGAIAFNTDISSTLYELLGHGPVMNRPEFGSPLFAPTANDASKYHRNSYMIASSYGPLYGLLSENGSKLFIENETLGVAETEEFFDLSQDPQATQNLLTDEIRRNGEAELRRCIQQIADLFGYRYKAPSILDWLNR